MRLWFLCLVIVLLLGAAVALGGYGYLYYKFANQVQEFDLSKLEKMEGASVIYDRHGIPMGKIFIQNRLPISFSEIPKSMVHAIVAEEDNRYFEHHGVDYFGILRAAISNYRQGRIKQGASTVTQQLARNSFELRERSFQRKFVEMFLAERIEQSFSKEKIMELYLNRVYFGSGFYGVEAAAMGYFGKHAKELSVAECAMLAGLLKSPNALSPWNNPRGATGVRDFVLQRMREMHFITTPELKNAVASSLGIQKRSNPFKVSYAVDLVRQQAIAALGFERAMNGGVRIDTTFDSQLQKTAETALSRELEKVEQSPGYSHETYQEYHERNSKLEEKVAQGGFLNFPTPAYLQGAVLAIDNQTGGILALVGGRDFTHSEYNRAVQGRRPPGTLFTPFVAAAAYSKGIFPGMPVDDACIDNHYVMIGGDTGILGEWGVERADNSYEGPMTTDEAVARGKNAAVVRLGFMTGLEALKSLVSKAGIHAPVREVANAYLGSSEMGLDDMTLAFSTFPGEGSRSDHLYTITKITDADGAVLFKTADKRVPVITPEVAFQTHVILDDALHKTDAAEIKQDGLASFPSGGKSGTAYDFTDVWFEGYSSAVTCGVWIGFDKPQKIYRGAFGKDLALPVWTSIMNASLASFPAKPMMPPSTLHAVEVCRSSGLLVAPECKGKAGPNTVITEYATALEIPTTECDLHGTGTRTYKKDLNEEEWPRAVSAVDLNSIPSIVVTGPTLLMEIPKAVPDASYIMQGNKKIPIEKAIPINGSNAVQATTGNSPLGTTPLPVEKQVAKEPEVRRAEPVRPMDIPSDATAPPLAKPKAIDFSDDQQ